MYEEWGGAPSAGVVTGLARVHGRLVMLIVNDATVKAGAFFPMTAKKVIRAQNIAIDNHIPTIYLVDSAGVFLPLQEDVFPDTDDFGRVFRNNAVMSAMGIPQIAAIMGMCVAGGGYLPVMCDHVLMTEGSGLFLAGPALVQAAIGAKYTAEELGGAKMHAEISGTVDYREPDDESCIARIRSLVDKMGNRQLGIFDRKEAASAALRRRRDLRHLRRRRREAVRHEGDHRPHRRRQPLRRIPPRVRRDGDLRLCAHRRLRRRHRRQPEDARAPDRSLRQQARGVRRRHLYRVGGEGGALHHGLQPEHRAAALPARCQRLHGGPRRGVERHHPRRARRWSTPCRTRWCRRSR